MRGFLVVDDGIRFFGGAEAHCCGCGCGIAWSLSLVLFMIEIVVVVLNFYWYLSCSCESVVCGIDWRSIVFVCA